MLTWGLKQIRLASVSYSCIVLASRSLCSIQTTCLQAKGHLQKTAAIWDEHYVTFLKVFNLGAFLWLLS